MNGKLEKAFEYYLGLGINRSYRAVAEHFEVSLRAVSKCGSRERWQEHVREYERETRNQIVKRLISHEVDRRANEHLKIVEIQGRAVEELARRPINNVYDAIEVLDAAMRLERAIVDRKHESTRLQAMDYVRRSGATN